MISIRQNLSELDRCHQARRLLLECYVDALRNAAQYAVELDGELTGQHRRYMSSLAEDAARGELEALVESRATLRGLLRDYHDKAAAYLGQLRDELAGTARALEEITASMGQTDEDHETRMRDALLKLRGIAQVSGGEFAESLGSTARLIEHSLEQMRRQNQITVSQFRTEIRMLHQRIDALEAAASMDDATKMFSRGEIEKRIRSLPSGAHCLLLVKAAGIRLASTSFSREVSAELAGAFAKRLRNSLPERSVIGRWGEEDFVTILPPNKAEAIRSGKYIAEHLGGFYACLFQGKTIRPALKIRTGVIDSGSEKIERTLERMDEFLGQEIAS